MAKKRVDRLNSLLKEVISEVIRKQVKNPHVNEFITVIRVDITADLHYAKVYISVIGSETEKQETLAALNSAAGFIAVNSSKKITLRYFPALTFILDDSIEKQMRIEQLLHTISDERKSRDPDSQENDLS
ncbi:Ribosome-binding factor A [Chlamydiales bacterium STE3]|nr:Ribosome-binding factor A [Chlamydiales bacterium STE3]